MIKVETETALISRIPGLLAISALIIAQEWLPTEFDWRVGILDRKVLFVARYCFPAGHWQIIKRDEQQHKLNEGATQAIPVNQAPEEVVWIALKSANLIGDGFYGVDIKQIDNRCYVIEVNDNPNVDAGNEDAVAKDTLYREVMSTFLKRIEARKQGGLSKVDDGSGRADRGFCRVATADQAEADHFKKMLMTEIFTVIRA